MKTPQTKMKEIHNDSMRASSELAEKTDKYMALHPGVTYNQANKFVLTLEDDDSLIRRYLGQNEEATPYAGEFEEMTPHQAGNKLFDLTKARQDKTEETFKVAQKAVFAEEPELAKIYTLN